MKYLFLILATVLAGAVVAAQQQQQPVADPAPVPELTSDLLPLPKGTSIMGIGNITPADLGH